MTQATPFTAFPNRFKQDLKAGKQLIGCWASLANPITTEILGLAGYDWLPPSAHPDPLQREAENDERIREFAAILLRRRRIQDPALTPVIEEGLLAALRLYLAQRSPCPLSWVADAFDPSSQTRSHMLAYCTEPNQFVFGSTENDPTTAHRFIFVLTPAH